jgi:hypothetical protein
MNQLIRSQDQGENVRLVIYRQTRHKYAVILLQILIVEFYYTAHWGRQKQVDIFNMKG